MADQSQVLENPNLETSLATIKEAISKHQCAIIIGDCQVEYQGRARSTLEPGERIVIVKEDGATLVHRPTGYEPVNWQPAESYIRTGMSGDTLVLTTVRRRPSESLKISFHQIKALVTMKMVDTGRFDLHVSEKEMQQAIVAEPEIVEEGFRPITYEKRVEPGFLDIYGHDKSGNLVVIEIKRGKAGKNAILQLARYVDDVKTTANRDVRGVLAAPQLSKGLQRLLSTLSLEYKRIDLERCAEVLKAAEGKKIKDFF